MDVRQAREQQGHARDITIVLAGLVGAAEINVIEARPIGLGVARNQRPDRHSREIVGADLGERAAIAADGRARRIADENIPHRSLHFRGFCLFTGRGGQGQIRSESGAQRCICPCGSRRPDAAAARQSGGSHAQARHARGCAVLRNVVAGRSGDEWGDPHRRSQRHVERLFRLPGSGLGRCGANGGRGFRQTVEAQGGNPLGRSPEQTRHRRGDRAALVRCRRRRHDHRRAEFRRRAGGCRYRARQEQGLHRLGRRHCFADRREMLAQHRALDLRYLGDGPRRRARPPAARRQDLVLRHRRLCFWR